MGVYIKGLSMPENCESCQFSCISDLFIPGWVGCQFDIGMAKKESFKGRHPNCPLVEVKVPHGRVIDVGTVTHAYYQRPTYSNLCNAINNAPTVLEAED